MKFICLVNKINEVSWLSIDSNESNFIPGCAQQLEDLFIEEASERGVKLTRAELDVVYAGDHPISDVRAAQQCCRAWRAVSVCEVSCVIIVFISNDFRLFSHKGTGAV